MEALADDLCECAKKTGDDAKKCLDEVSSSWTPKLGDKARQSLEQLKKTATPRDKAAVDRGADCALRATGR